MTARFLNFLFLSLLISSNAIINLKFQRRPEFDNFITKSYDVHSVNNVAHCLVICMLRNPCISLFYNEEQRQCKLNSIILWKVKNIQTTSWKYYERNSPNVAVNKEANQSSTHLDIPDHFADKAVDGQYKQRQYGMDCTTTAVYEVSPWLYVDLGTPYFIDFVSIFNRYDAEGARLHDLKITVGDTASDFPFLCGVFDGPATEAEIVQIQCKSGISGQYLRVQINGSDGLKDNILTMCELEIHGTNSN